MFSLIKQVFIVLSFSSSLATKCVSLYNESYMIRPSLTDLNPFGLKYYPFMISLDNCNGSCNVMNCNVKSYRQKYMFQKNNKVKAFKAFNMVTNKNGVKTIAKHSSCDFKCKFSSTTCNSNKKRE